MFCKLSDMIEGEYFTSVLLYIKNYKPKFQTHKIYFMS